MTTTEEDLNQPPQPEHEKSLEQRYYEEYLERVTAEVKHPTETIEQVRLLLDELTTLVGKRVVELTKQEARTEEEDASLTEGTAFFCKLAPMALRYAEKEVTLKAKYPYQKPQPKVLPNPADMLGYERYIQKRIRRFVHENGFIAKESAEMMRLKIIELEDALAAERGIELPPPTGPSVEEQFQSWKAAQPLGWSGVIESRGGSEDYVDPFVGEEQDDPSLRE